jgi:hypothetical protein
MVRKSALQISEGEMTWCKHSGRYRGVSIGRDDDGYFVATHRARSKSYPYPGAIPEKELAWIVRNFSSGI